MTSSTSPESGSKSDNGFANDADAAHLAQLGYKQELHRNFSAWSIASFGITLTGTWCALGGALYGGLPAGGPPGVIYGFILVFVGQCFVGATIAELASSYPTTGGMYHWTAVLAPRTLAPILSWITGWNTIWAYVTSVASVCCVSGSQIVALVSLARGTGFEVQRWHIFLALEILNILSFLLVVYGNRIMPMLQKVSLWWYISSLITCSITILAMAPTHRTAHEVFADFINSTGWSTNGMAFISGLVNPAFAIAVLDSTTHLSEEVPQPERNVPKAIGWTLFPAFFQGWFFLMAMFFSYQDLDGMLESETWLPVAELFRQATGSSAGGFGMTFLLMISGICTVWDCQLSQGRIYWAFARDNAVPFSKVFAHVSPSFGVPFRAHLLTAFLVALLGLLYMWAETAFNAFIAANLVFFNLTYLVPVSINLLRKVRTPIRGPFHLGRWGFAINAIALVWIIFLAVFLQFPYYMPVTAAEMNYTCVIIGGGLIFEAVFYLFKRTEYRGPHLDAGLSEVIESLEHEDHAVPVRLSAEVKS